MADIEENIIDELERKCAEAGTNLNQVCKEAKIDRNTLVRWKHQNPRTIQILRSLERAIDTIAKDKKKLRKPAQKQR